VKNSIDLLLGSPAGPAGLARQQVIPLKTRPAHFYVIRVTIPTLTKLVTFALVNFGCGFGFKRAAAEVTRPRPINQFPADTPLKPVAPRGHSYRSIYYV